jgi:hypothetical protein
MFDGTLQEAGLLGGHGHVANISTLAARFRMDNRACGCTAVGEHDVGLTRLRHGWRVWWSHLHGMVHGSRNAQQFCRRWCRLWRVGLRLHSRLCRAGSGPFEIVE